MAVHGVGLMLSWGWRFSGLSPYAVPDRWGNHFGVIEGVKALNPWFELVGSLRGRITGVGILEKSRVTDGWPQ